MQLWAVNFRDQKGPALSSAFLVGWNVIIVTGAAAVLLDHEMGPKSTERQGLAHPGLLRQLRSHQPGQLKEVLKGEGWQQEGMAGDYHTYP